MDRTYRFRDLVLQHTDIETLLPGNWLNDQVIEVALAFEEENAGEYPTVRCVPPSTSQLILHAPDIAPSIVRDLDLVDPLASTVLLCVNNATDLSQPLAGSHWSALVATRSADCTMYRHYDSIGTNNLVAEELASVLSTCDGFPGKPKVFHDRSFNGGYRTRPTCVRTPVRSDSLALCAACFVHSQGRQTNSCDCGVFLLAVARAHMTGKSQNGEDAAFAVQRRLDGIDQNFVGGLREELLRRVTTD